MKNTKNKNGSDLLAEFAENARSLNSSLRNSAEKIHKQNVKGKSADEVTSRKAAYGTAGMKLDTHANKAAQLAALGKKPHKVFNDLGLKVNEVMKSTDEKGFSRECKKYTISACLAIAYRHFVNIPFGEITKNIKAIDAKASGIEKIDRSGRHYLWVLCTKDKISYYELLKLRNPTQTSNFFTWINKMAEWGSPFATIDGKGESRVATIDTNSVLVKMVRKELKDYLKNYKPEVKS